MGRLIRRFIRVYKETFAHAIEGGNWTTPITQDLAGQVLVSGVVNAIALGGDVVGGYFGVKSSVTAVSDPRAVRARTTINTGVVLTGSSFGVHVEDEVLGTGRITGNWEGMRIEQYAEAGATLSGPVFGIFITNFLQVTPAMMYSFFRASENGGAVVTGLLTCTIGGGSDLTSAFHFSGDPVTAWSAIFNPPGGVATGRLRCYVHGEVRYIQLYT